MSAEYTCELIHTNCAKTKVANVSFSRDQTCKSLWTCSLRIKGSRASCSVDDDSQNSPTTQELRTALEKGSDDVKLNVLRTIIVSTLNGQAHPQLLMPIIQHVLPSKNKAIKKLLHFYFEVCPKLDENGKLKQEMILVWSVPLALYTHSALIRTCSNAIRNDLQHPNEYIRGATLRHLQKITEPELLEPLIPTCRSCLEHRHSYVRKNAVFAVYQIYQRNENLIPDAPELIHTFLIAESDSTCRRNAFIMLAHCAPARAIDYFLSVYDGLDGLDEQMQLAAIELIRKDVKDTKGETQMKARYIRAIFQLLSDKTESRSVKYEAAGMLTSLTQNPAAVKATATAYIDLIVKESDNNVKLIVLDRVEALRARNDQGVLDDLAMDILRVLTSPDMEVKKKALQIALDLVSSRNVEEVVQFLKKELVRTLDAQYEKVRTRYAVSYLMTKQECSYGQNTEYRQVLIQSIHTCAIKYSEVASNVVHVLLEFLGDSNNTAAVDVISFVREVVEKFPDLRKGIIEKLRDTFVDIKSGKVFRGALWIVGEYAADVEGQCFFAAKSSS